MLKYVYNRIFFAAVTLLILGIDISHDVPIWIYLFVYLAYISLSFYGSYFIQSNFYVEAICHGDRNKKAVALTLDDGPVPQHTHTVLEILRAENVQSCFFVIGKNMDGNEDILKSIDREGHVVGNHSFEHNF